MVGPGVGEGALDGVEDELGDRAGVLRHRAARAGARDDDPGVRGDGTGHRAARGSSPSARATISRITSEEPAPTVNASESRWSRPMANSSM